MGDDKDSSFAALLGALARAPEQGVDDVAVADLPAGHRVGRYAVVERLGVGAMGAVYRARDDTLGRDVAVKVLFSAAARSTVDRFQREVVALASVRHPNIVAVHDAGVADGRPYVVLELVEGQTLRERLRAGPLPAADVRRLATDLARGLGAAHTVGIIHRDLKPENILLGADGTAKLVDFGLARLVERDDAHEHGLTESGLLLGTAHYMAPEQVRGQRVDQRADYYALGAVILEAITGRRVFEAPSRAEVLSAVLRDPPPVDPGFFAGPEAQRILGVALRCLQKEASRRYATAADILGVLESDDVPPPLADTDADADDSYEAPPDIPTTHYATSSGVHIAYQVVGPPGLPTLVAAPPFISNIEVIWESPNARRMLRSVASFTHYVHFDRRGVGMSDPIDPGCTLDERVEDLRAVLDAEGIDRAFLMGVSEGGPISVAFAAKYPERTRGLILMGTFARPLRGDGYEHGPSREEIAWLLDKWAERWGTPKTLSVAMFAASRVGDAEYLRWGNRYERQCVSPGAARRLLDLQLTIDVRHLLADVRCPVLVMHRRGDPAVPVAHGRYVAEHIAGARFVELEGNDHAPWEGDGEAPLALVREFIDEVVERERPD